MGYFEGGSNTILQACSISSIYLDFKKYINNLQYVLKIIELWSIRCTVVIIKATSFYGLPFF